MEKLWPGAIAPESKLPSSAVTVWLTVSLFTQVTVVFTGTTNGLVPKAAVPKVAAFAGICTLIHCGVDPAADVKVGVTTGEAVGETAGDAVATGDTTGETTGVAVG